MTNHTSIPAHSRPGFWLETTMLLVIAVMVILGFLMMGDRAGVRFEPRLAKVVGHTQGFSKSGQTYSLQVQVDGAVAVLPVSRWFYENTAAGTEIPVEFARGDWIGSLFARLPTTSR